MNKIQKIGKYLKNLLYPQDIKCIFCDEELEISNKYDTCNVCFEALPYIKTSCPRCGAPILENNTGVCINCKINNYYFDRAIPVFESCDQIVEIIHKVKYGGGKYYLKPLSEYLIDKFTSIDFFADYITYVPMYCKKEKSRGYNQAKILAENVANSTSIECVPLINKIKDTDSQASLDYKSRKENVKDCFKFNKELDIDIKDKNILLIDDILTTGSTSSEICKILKEKGAKSCFVLTLAHGRVDEVSPEDN